MKIVFASNNLNKLREIEGLIPEGLELVSLRDIKFYDEVEETGQTLEENSLIKATAVYNFCKLATIADDTGLEVDALNGQPGVYSARYAGAHKSSSDNIDKLLTQLKGEENRAAQFRTVFTLKTNDLTLQFEGIVSGSISTEVRGIDGFGYDPIFIPEGLSKTFAEMSLEEKNQRSHRARALKKVTDFINNEFSKIG